MKHGGLKEIQEEVKEEIQVPKKSFKEKALSLFKKSPKKKKKEK